MEINFLKNVIIRFRFIFTRLFRRKNNLSALNPRRGYDLWAHSYQQESNPVKTLANESLENLMPDLINLSVLDLGCGTGHFCEVAERREAVRTVGIDFSRGMIRIAKTSVELKRTILLLGHVEWLPFKEETFDILICGLVMGHLKEIDQAISQIADVLKPNGILLISDFHPFQTIQGMKRTFKSVKDNRSYEIEHHLHLYETYFDCFKKNGLIIEELKEPMWNGIPLVFAMRAKKIDKR